MEVVYSALDRKWNGIAALLAELRLDSRYERVEAPKSESVFPGFRPEFLGSFPTQLVRAYRSRFAR
jgi:hypothetical protein